MPKRIDLGILLELYGERPPVANPHYALFLLGTDTQFIPRPTGDRVYPNGETLSYAAQLMTTIFHETPEIDGSLDSNIAFSAPSVDLINGPDTKGTNVGKKIAMGVFLVLQALAEGKTHVFIAGHSRGAAETLLVAQELKRIFLGLQKKDGLSLFQILSQTPCAYTKAAFQFLFKDLGESQELRTWLLEKLAALFEKKSDASKLEDRKKFELHLFLIDPVPGGDGVPFLRWLDERFYSEPPADSVELIAALHERTRCFNLIIPNGVRVTALPGHHGTFSGNLFSQQGEDLPATISEERRDTSTAQKLVLLKYLHFVNQAMAQGLRVQAMYDLSHPAFDQMTYSFLVTDLTNRRKQLRAAYNRVHENQEAFFSYTKTSYKVLGLESTASGARIVHFGQYNRVGLDTVIVSFDGSFVNTEHAILFLQESMELDLHAERIEPHYVGLALKRLFTQLFSGFEGLDPKANQLLSTPRNRAPVFEAISLCLEMIGQKYLLNHLTYSDKTDLIRVLADILGFLDRYKIHKNATLKEAATDCDTLIKEHVIKVITRHQQRLLEQSDEYASLIRRHMHPEVQVASPDELDAQGLLMGLQHLYENLNSLIQNKPALEACLGQGSAPVQRMLSLSDSLGAEVVDAPSVEIQETILGFHLDRVLKLAGLMVKHFNYSLRDQPECLSLDFFNQLRPWAILQGAADPEILARDQRISDLTQTGLRLEQSSLSLEARVSTLHLELATQADLLSSARVAEAQARQAHQALLKEHHHFLAINEAAAASRQADQLGYEQRLRVFEESNSQAYQALAAENAHLCQLNQELRDRQQTAQFAHQQELARIQALSAEAQLRLTQDHEGLALAQDEAHARDLTVLEQDLIQARQARIQMENREQGSKLRAEQAEARVRALEGIAQALCSPRERRCADLIDQELLPQAIKYLGYLAKAAAKLNSNITLQFHRNFLADQALPEYQGKLKNRAAYEKIARKYEAVQVLVRALNNVQANPLASQRIQDFRVNLARQDLILGQHRDSAWVCFFKSCFVIMGVLATGVVPGLLALKAYANASKRSCLFFAHSHGREYADRAFEKSKAITFEPVR